MTVLVFVDTNVLVYAQDARESVKQPMAANWISQLWITQTGRTSTQVLSEYYVTMTRKLDPGLKPADAWDDVQSLLAWRPQGIDVALLRRARDVEQRYRISWWDSLIVAAAQAQACSILLSEDLQDESEFGDVTVRNPFKHSASEAIPRYQTALLASSLHHPARGRPRRATRA
jgi:predicted nucleic acid-binding protein